jgi:hypothetical protein
VSWAGIGRVLLFAGAAVAGWQAFTSLRLFVDLARTLVVEIREFRGAGGLGAVSMGVTWVDLAPLLCLIANRVSKKWVLRRGGLPRKVHRAHSFALLAFALLWIAGFVMAVAMPDASWYGALLILWGVIPAVDVVQLLLLATLLIMLGMPQPSVVAGGA